MAYFKTVSSAFSTTIKGLGITLKHLVGANRSRGQHTVCNPRYFDEDRGIFTMSFPEERMEVPSVGRYTLHCEIDDCIVCDKCARICPVSCIDIVPVKSAEVFDHASDGTAKRIYAARFDIDMAKCCFCGLCTTVCPTECLTMTSDYDHVTKDVREMTFPFATMTTEEAVQKQQDYEKAQAEKAAAKAAATPAKPPANDQAASDPKPAGAKPTFRPIIKPRPATSPVDPAPENLPDQPVASAPDETVETAKGQSQKTPDAPSQESASPAAKPAFRPYLRKPNPPGPDAGPSPAPSGD